MRNLSRLFLVLLATTLFAAGCGGNTTTTDTPNLDQVGDIGLQFSTNGSSVQARFSQAASYRVAILIPGTLTQLVPTLAFQRIDGPTQTVLVQDIPAGTVELVLEALDGASNIVGQARASNVVVNAGQTTLVDSSMLQGFGVSQGIDFTGEDTSGETPTLTVEVSAGTTPTYTFTGSPVRDVSVVRVNDPNNPQDVTPVWVATAVDVDAINSPVVHGPLPAGATLLAVNAEPVLTAGQLYRVSVVKLNGEFGFTEFTP
ncbi:hypothetical protein DYH09_11405 [bacterium CPR1]|nr:hypothetical protein [bacterium CPR1]